MWPGTFTSVLHVARYLGTYPTINSSRVLRAKSIHNPFPEERWGTASKVPKNNGSLLSALFA